MDRLDDVATVETPEQIELALPLAGVGSRALAFILDFLIQLIPISIAMVVVVVTNSITLINKTEKGDVVQDVRPSVMAAAVFSVIVFVTNFLYFTFFDLVSGGQSPGKRALKLRVVRDGGLAVDARSSLIRNLVRTVDMLPGFYVLGLISIFVSREHKRIGDLAGGTLVIRDRAEAVGDLSALVSPRPALLAQGPAGSAPALSGPDRALLHDYLERRDKLPEEARHRVARQIADTLAARYGVDAQLPPDAIIDQLARR
ncbi:MAG TPA: RDD family protein [Polyangia bacterium]|jgi:uncharacterized RDD family membrane protein YckC|nr:RDD family protein [Polyangia bacterium]